MINELSKQIHENNKAKGFYDEQKNIGEMLALIHSEVSEALEAHRKGQRADLSAAKQVLESTDFIDDFKSNIKDTFEDELADVMIRVMDLAGYLNIDLDSHIKAKLEYNKTRPYKHGKKY